jgi:hypothetical protein
MVPMRIAGGIRIVGAERPGCGNLP